ncbi:MAG: zinc ribbon domain-containing protein [Myxococcales bacterium]|nr:zinc ribbon domain-containing protein [Myxococcales bacterium]
MAACARCGAVPEPGATVCPSCGAAADGARATAPLGSDGEPRLGSGTLVLGSGVPIDGPLPAPPPPKPEAESARPRRHEPRPNPLRVRQRLRVERPPEPARVAETPPPPRTRRLPWALWLGVPVLVLGGLVLVSTLSRRRSVAAEARFDAGGRPELHLSCPSCPDGTSLSLGEASAVTRGGHAILTLPPPLSLGRQRSTLEVKEPGQSRARREELEYEVDFVLSADQRGLGHPEPKLALVFDAKPEVSFVVDGRVVAPSPNGIRRYELGVRQELTGPAKQPTTLRKKIPYLIKRPTGESIRGEIELVVPVVPLSVDAPGESIVIEGSSFVLAGATERDGLVTVEGRPITVDPSGRFAQLMSVSAIGDTTVSVRASAPGRAPRFFPIRVKRVASLAAEAALFERRAQGSYAAIADAVEQKVGWAVVLEGKLTEVKSDGYASSLLLDVDKGCREPPCLVRLALGERTSLAPGAGVTAYGYLAGKSAESVGGRGLPEVRVEFLRGRP